jgi:hypothetical protein
VAGADLRIHHGNSRSVVSLFSVIIAVEATIAKNIILSLRNIVVITVFDGNICLALSPLGYVSIL